MCMTGQSLMSKTFDFQTMRMLNCEIAVICSAENNKLNQQVSWKKS